MAYLTFFFFGTASCSICLFFYYRKTTRMLNIYENMLSRFLNTKDNDKKIIQNLSCDLISKILYIKDLENKIEELKKEESKHY